MSLPLDRLTIKAREAVMRAQQSAEDRHHQFLTPLHLLAALLEERNGVVVSLFDRIGVDTAQLRNLVEGELDRLPQVSGTGADLSASPGLPGLFTDARRRAEAMGDSYLSTEHLLLALSTCEDTAGRLLHLCAVEESDVLEALELIRGNQQVTDEAPEDKYDALGQYGKDLVELAHDGRLDPVIGRDQEIRRVIQVLSRRRKNNPVLIGEPGVGKTAIVEGLGEMFQRNWPTRVSWHWTWAR